jgi:hypothetical protein
MEISSNLAKMYIHSVYRPESRSSASEPERRVVDEERRADETRDRVILSPTSNDALSPNRQRVRRPFATLRSISSHDY